MLDSIDRMFVGICTDFTNENENAPLARLDMAVDISIAPLPHARTGVFWFTQPVVSPLPTE